jgi:hypothetical protein
LLTAIGTYEDLSTEDITEQVKWLVNAPNDEVIEISGTQSPEVIVSNGAVSNDIARVTATLSGVVSNTIGINACITLAGPCIDIYDATNGDGTGVLYTSSPSVKYLENVDGVVYSRTLVEDGTLDPLGIPYGPPGMFATFSVSSTTSGEAFSLCDVYSSIELGDRTNWRLPYLEELELPDYTGMNAKRGWPTTLYYWSAPLPADVDTNIISSRGLGALANVFNYDLNDAVTTFLYVSCISSP